MFAGLKKVRNFALAIEKYRWRSSKDFLVR